MIFKQIINTARIDSENKNFLVDYYLVKKMYNHRRQKICYGIGVEKYVISDGEKEVLEREEVSNICYDADDALKILNILYDNTVTPMTVLDVLDDIID